MADAIFISYRRDDAEGEAGRLFDDLTRAFGRDAVFMDVAGIKPGVDFRRAIEQNVASCGVLLAVIGPRWVSTARADGTRRLDDPNDFVALEIASAMRREMPVIPVLVHEAVMPAVDKLPESIKDLAFHNSVEVSHARWNSDVALLVEALKAYSTPTSAGGQAIQPGSLNQPHSKHPLSSPSSAAAKKSRIPMLMPLGLGAALVLVIVVVFALHSSPSASSTSPPSQTPSTVEIPATSSSTRPSVKPRAPRPYPSQPQVTIPSTAPSAAAPPSGIVKIMNVHSGFCLSPAGGVSDRNAEIVQYVCDEDPSWSWRVTALGDNLYQILNVSSHLCLTVAGGVTDRNTVSVQYLCDADASRQWRYVERDGGTFRFVNLNSGLCLTVSGGVKDRNARAVQFPCDEDPARDWKFLSLQ